VDVEDRNEQVVVTMSRDEFFLIQSLMMEALETGDDRGFETRVGATKADVRSLIGKLPDLPLHG
jgi:hypothetical protein